MRVIGGEFRSRRLKSIPGLATRPTPDRLRETLFDILGAQVEGAVFLDAYAGTGAVGIEALSRGAARAIFIEKSKNAAKVLHENLASLEIEGRALVMVAATLSSIAAQDADLVFLDPPYEREAEYAPALRLLGVNPPRLVAVQHCVRFTLAESYGVLKRTRVVKQGDNALSFFASM
ncbi:MAG TPA: 16S rRNA (guanine(966)-N(2))-methyltransferase RsmD [Bryobacteraceae bacterium]|nr:16S rRNA (guanine(966)-N(2))-methyltransferase RsmD [Bryobacteraceae bacterium]